MVLDLAICMVLMFSRTSRTQTNSIQFSTWGAGKADERVRTLTEKFAKKASRRGCWYSG